MPTSKQTAYLRLIQATPGATIQQLTRAYNNRFGGGAAGTETDKNAYQCVAKMRSAGWVRCGEPSLGRGLGHHLTESGAALIGATYAGSPEPTRFVDGLGAPAMVGPVIQRDERTGVPTYADALARTSDKVVAVHAAPHEPPKRTDLTIHNIRMALQEARRAHEKIVDSRGGPQVLVDIRAAATIRALELITDKLAKVAP